MGGSVLIFEPGDLVIQGVRATKARLETTGPHFLDFSKIQQMDGAGFQLILAYIQKVGVDQVKIRGVGESLQGFFDLAGWDWKPLGDAPPSSAKN